MAVSLREDIGHSGVVRGEIRPFAHAPLASECGHDSSCSTLFDPAGSYEGHPPRRARGGE
jgi:hypothetical protein